MKDINVIAGSDMSLFYDGLSIDCTGDIFIDASSNTSEAIYGINYGFTVKNARNVTVISNNQSSSIEKAINIKCSGDILLQNYGKAVHNPGAGYGGVKFSQPANCLGFVVKAGDSMDALSIYDDKNENEEYFSDKLYSKGGVNGTKIIKVEAKPIPAPTLLEGDNQNITFGEQTALTFKSSSRLAHFVRVEMDGTTVPPEKYTASEGSTIITLNPLYVASLSTGTHTIGIVSVSGTATATFSVNAPTSGGTGESGGTADNNNNSNDENINVANTGDDANLLLLIILLALSTSSFVFYKKKEI